MLDSLDRIDIQECEDDATLADGPESSTLLRSPSQSLESQSPGVHPLDGDFAQRLSEISPSNAHAGFARLESAHNFTQVTSVAKRSTRVASVTDFVILFVACALEALRWLASCSRDLVLLVVGVLIVVRNWMVANG
jgi:hypothetical protein